MVRRSLLALGVVALLLVSASGAAAPASRPGVPSARAFAVQVSVPGRAGALSASVSTPPDAVGVGGGFAYPADGSAVKAGSVTSGAFAAPGATTTASASADVTGLSLFGGDVTAESISVRAKASAGARAATGDTSVSAVSGLVLVGQAVAAGPGMRVPLADWGYATVLEQASAPTSTAGARGYRAGVIGLYVHLTAEHAGLPAGTDIVVGFAEASARTASPEPPSGARLKPDRDGGKIRRPRGGDGPNAGNSSRLEIPPLIRRAPPTVTPKLTAGGYVFPVYGPSSFADTWGAPRANPVGWHHGADIFAPLGAPMLAVARGTVYSVGFNRIGGLRLWLRDLQGNEFYYAHLSAFSPLAVNGAQVKAGEVLGFVGNTGDAEGTPYHLHFEIHPVSLLHLGYDGAVDPTPYLRAWEHLQDLPFTAVAGWAPPVAATSRAPKPGAILLQVSDISSASGLDPESLERALRLARPETADGSLTALLRAGRAARRLSSVPGR